MPLTPVPGPYTTFDGSLIGAVNGANTTYTALSNPILLLYSLTGVTGSSLLFRDGLLQDPSTDYIEGPGYFGLPTPVGTGTIAARVYQGGAVTRLNRDNGGLIFTGTRSIRESAPGLPVRTLASNVILFRNGRQLTNTLDYTLPASGWIQLSVAEAYVTGDVFTALIDTFGSGVSSTTGGITGLINAVNTTFTLIGGPGIGTLLQVMLFLNGLYQREGYDYVRLGSTQIVFSTPPQTGDNLSARIFGNLQVPLLAPVQITTSDGSLFYPPAPGGLVFVNGLLMTQGVDATLNGNVVTLARPPLPG